MADRIPPDILAAVTPELRERIVRALAARRLASIELFAWLGEDDELGSGIVGLKQALVPAGYIPLVATTQAKVDRETITVQMEGQASAYGKKIYLCRFTLQEIVASTAEGEPLE